jgi:hypothetical protein
MFGFGHKSSPRPLHPSEFKEAYRQAEAHLRQVGKSGSVLVRLDVDAEGHVVSSRAIDPPWIARFGTMKAILVDARTGERLPEPPARSDDPEVRQLAADVARKLTFTPATRRGQAVSHRGYRMTIAFR